MKKLYIIFDIHSYTVCFVIIRGLLDPSVQNEVMYQAGYSRGSNDRHPFLLETVERRPEFIPSG